jgi:hypothetical protein
LTPEDLAQEANAASRRNDLLRETYDEPVTLVGKDVVCEVGMRVRMAEGMVSHGEGTVVEVVSGTEDGCCQVIWDSDQSHTRQIHAKLGNSHICRIGKEGCFDLVLADLTACADLEIKVHSFVQRGRKRDYLEVVRKCDEDQLPADEHGDFPMEQDAERSPAAARASSPEAQVTPPLVAGGDES